MNARETDKKEHASLSDDRAHQDSQENLDGVFAVLLAVAKRVDPEKYLAGYRNNND